MFLSTEDKIGTSAIFLTEGFDFTTRVILDTGSGPTFTSRQLLPDDTQLQPLGELASTFHDVNRGWLPIVGSVCLGVALWGQTSYISFHVVEGMSVPAILGTSLDIATKNTATQEQHVELFSGTGRPPLYHNHGVQVAQGPSIMVSGEPSTVQVMHLGAMLLRLTNEMTVGDI